MAHVHTMQEVMPESTARERFNMLLLTIFGAAALILLTVGIYGLIAYSVAQRTQEMGIRMALGADRSAIRNLVVWHGLKLAIHVEQYHQLGVITFSDLYVRGFLNGGGYEGIPLERNAYLLGARYAQNPAGSFSWPMT